MTPDRAAQFIRLDQLLSKPGEELSEEELNDLDELAHLLMDPEYRWALIKAAEKQTRQQ